jgi:hypothetical protein
MIDKRIYFFIYNLIFTYFLVSQLGQSRTGTGTRFSRFPIIIDHTFSGDRELITVSTKQHCGSVTFWHGSVPLTNIRLWRLILLVFVIDLQQQQKILSFLLITF